LCLFSECGEFILRFVYSFHLISPECVTYQAIQSLLIG